MHNIKYCRFLCKNETMFGDRCSRSAEYGTSWRDAKFKCILSAFQWFFMLSITESAEFGRQQNKLQKSVADAGASNERPSPIGPNVFILTFIFSCNVTRARGSHKDCHRWSDTCHRSNIRWFYYSGHPQILIQYCSLFTIVCLN